MNNLRQYRKSGIRKALLTEERIKALNSIGMQWEVLDYLFERNYLSAFEYYEKHGNLNVPVDYVDQDGIKLGSWLARLRTSKNRGRLNLSDKQVVQLNKIGMCWGTEMIWLGKKDMKRRNAIGNSLETWVFPRIICQKKDSDWAVGFKDNEIIRRKASYPGYEKRDWTLLE